MTKYIQRDAEIVNAIELKCKVQVGGGIRFQPGDFIVEEGGGWTRFWHRIDFLAKFRPLDESVISSNPGEGPGDDNIGMGY